MIYVTGDIHGEADRLGPETLKQRGIDMQPDDYIIVCGDFGIPWVGEKDEDDHRQLEWLAQLPYTILFVDGNHENFDLLSRYPVKEWAGGRVHELRPNLYHLLRGEVFTIEGKTFFTFGGAKLTDKSQRWPGVSWWPQENASESNFDNAAKNLMAHDFTVDYVITHTAPARFIDDKKGTWTWRIVGCKTSKLLSGLEELMTYKKWYFGHFHVDYIRDDSVAAWMYKDVVPVGK